MRFFIDKFKWLMLLAGLATCSMFLGLFLPEKQVQDNFGQTLTGPVAEILVRNWSALIGMNGIMLIYGAFRPAVRKFALVITGLSKLGFIILVLIYGTQFLSHGIGTAVIADSIMVILFAAYLVLSGKSDAA